MAAKITPVAPALSNRVVQGQGYSVSTAPQLPESAGVLSATMQQCARRALAADLKGGEALLDKAAALAEARQAAAPGEWRTFLEAINVHERAAQRLIAIHERATNDAAFRHGVERGWLSFSVAALVAHAEASLLEQLLLQEQPPTRSQIETLLAKPDTGVGSPAPEPAEPAAIPADFAAERARAVALGFDDLHVVRRGDRTEFMLRRNNDLYAQAGWSIIVAELDRWEQNAAPPAAGTLDGDWTTPDLPEMPDHLWQAEYRWVECTDTLAIIAGPGGWQGNAPTVAGALGLAEDRYAARMPTPQAQPAADDADAIASDIVAAARALGLIARLDGVDLWLYWPSEADSLAQDGDDGGGSLISPWRWPEQADVVRAWLRDDAPGLAPEPQPTSTPAPADWRRDPALQRAMERFNAAVRGNDRANVLHAARAVVAALEEREEA